jgi:hypothetical protein
MGLADFLMGGLNVFGTPDAMIKDVLYGLTHGTEIENPLRHLRNPTQDYGRKWGRDIVEPFVGPNKPGFDWGDIPGFAVDVAVGIPTWGLWSGAAKTAAPLVMEAGRRAAPYVAPLYKPVAGPMVRGAKATARLPVDMHRYLMGL